MDRDAELPACRQGVRPRAGFADGVEVDVEARKLGLDFFGHWHGGEVGFLEEGEDVGGGEVEELDADAEEEDADC